MKEEFEMFTSVSTRRGFAARLAALFPGLGIAGMAAAMPATAEQNSNAVQKLNGDGKPAGKGFITPLIVHNGLIYIAGQGAHSRGDKSDAGKTPTIEMHTQMVMDGVKATVEAGGGTMDSILQLTVFLAKLDYYDGMNSVFKTYFPNGGPARTTVAVAGLPGESLVEINCIAAVVRDVKKEG
jgi:2-iminobutanoate/2-iminopropanoate deaminase